MTRQDISYREIEAEERRKTLIRSVFIGQNPSAEEILTLPKEWVEKFYSMVLKLKRFVLCKLFSKTQ
jgi:hypothetical protein